MRRLLPVLLLLAAPFAAAQPDYTALVVSQGAFGGQNGSVVLVDGRGAGSTARPLAENRIYTQGAEVIGDRLYLTAGDSFSGTSRVDVLDAITGEPVGQVTSGLLNPRYLAEVAPGKAYVTNQDYSGGASFVAPFDLASGTVGARIEVEGMPEAVALSADGTRAFVALGAFGGRDSLAVLDPATDTLLGYVDLGCAARFVVATLTNVWAVCTDTDEAVGVDPATLSIVERVGFEVELGDPFGVGQDAAPLQTVYTTRTAAPPVADAVLIATETGLVVIGGASGEVLDTVPIADTAMRPITALGGYEGGYVLGRPDPANPFGAAGTVTVHDANGALQVTFGAGVFPAYVAVNPALVGSTSVAGAPAAGLALALAGPNPARQRTAVALSLDHAADVRAEVVDVLGRVVATLAAGPRPAGTHRLGVEAGALAPGTYRVRAVADGRVASLPLTVVR